MASSVLDARPATPREFAGVTAGLASALLVAPALGGIIAGPAPVAAAVVIAALSTAYGRVLVRLLDLPTRVPVHLVSVVLGFSAVSLVHLSATALLNIGVYAALLLDLAVAAALSLTTRRPVARAAPREDPSSRRRDVARQMGVLVACALLASLWGRETIGAVPHAAATGVFPAWQDLFLHASEISYVRDYPAFARHSQYLSAVPQPLYHRGSYAMSGLFSALGGVPSLSAATAFWLPSGLVLCMTATYAWGAAMGGAAAGLGAVAAVFLVPDASGYGLENRFLSFHWLLQMAGGSSYAVALVLVALMTLVTATPARGTRALAVAGALTLASAGFRVHVAALSTGMVCMLAVLAWRGRVKVARVVWGLAGAAVVAGALLWFESLAMAPHFLSARARPVDFFLSVHTQASALPSPWVHWTTGRGDVWKVLLGYGMMLVAGCGASLVALAAVWRAGALGRMGWRVAVVPAALAAAHLTVILLVPTPAHGDPTDFGHRPFVLVYLVVGALAGAGTARLLAEWSRRRFSSTAPASVAVITLAAVGLSVPWTVGARIQQRWTPAYAEIPVRRATLDAGAYVRDHSSPGEQVLAASEDPLAVLVALTERRGYLSRASLYRSLGPETAELADARTSEHATIAAVSSFEQLQAFGARTGVAWYVADTPATEAWPSEVTRRSVFRGDGVRVYDLR